MESKERRQPWGEVGSTVDLASCGARPGRVCSGCPGAEQDQCGRSIVLGVQDEVRRWTGPEPPGSWTVLRSGGSLGFNGRLTGSDLLL